MLGFAVVLLPAAACGQGDEEAGNAYVLNPRGARVLPQGAGGYSGEAARYLEHGRTVCRAAVLRVRVEGNQIIVSLPGTAVFPEGAAPLPQRCVRGCAAEMAANDARSRRSGWGGAAPPG